MLIYCIFRIVLFIAMRPQAAPKLVLAVHWARVLVTQVITASIASTNNVLLVQHTVNATIARVSANVTRIIMARRAILSAMHVSLATIMALVIMSREVVTVKLIGLDR